MNVRFACSWWLLGSPSLLAKARQFVKEKHPAADVDSYDIKRLGQEAMEMELDDVKGTIKHLGTILEDPEWVRQAEAMVGSK